MTVRNLEVIVIGLAIMWGVAVAQRATMTPTKWGIVVVGSVAVIAVMVMYPLYW